MAKGISTTKKKNIDMIDLGEKLLKFAQKTSPDKMEIDISKAKKEFGHYRNIILEAYAFGPEELKKYKIVESKTALPLTNVDPPRLTERGTITIKKFYIDEYNKKYPSNQIGKDDSFDATFEDGKIILTKA